MSQGRSPTHVIQGFYCPIPPMELRQKRLRSGIYIATANGIEKRCSRCREYWPIDTEFFFSSKKPDGLFQWCRACYMEFRWPERYGLPPRAAKVAA